MSFRARFYIPELRRIVHRPRRDERALGVETEADDLRQMPAESVEAFAVLGVPYLARLVEGARDDAVAEWVVERDRVHNVLVALEAQ